MQASILRGKSKSVHIYSIKDSWREPICSMMTASINTVDINCPVIFKVAVGVTSSVLNCLECNVTQNKMTR